VESLPGEIGRSVLLASKMVTDESGAIAGVKIETVAFRGGHSSAEIEAALVDLQRYALPAATKPVINALTELKLITRRRAEDVDDIGLTLMALQKRLAEYPGVVVLDVIQRLGDSGPWFPSWSEFKAACDVEVQRLAAVAALLEVACLQAEAREKWSDDPATYDLRIRTIIAEKRQDPHWRRAQFWLRGEHERWQTARRRELECARVFAAFTIWLLTEIEGDGWVAHWSRGEEPWRQPRAPQGGWPAYASEALPGPGDGNPMARDHRSNSDWNL
jgi:hypothetical protein